MIITLSGTFGAGRSTVADLLCRRINEYLGSEVYKRWSGGDAWEEEARKRGVTIVELTKLSETEPGIHDLVDRRLEKFNPNTDCLVIDALLGYLFVPKTKNHVSVFLVVSEAEGGRRVFEHQQAALRDKTQKPRTDEPLYKDPEAAAVYRHKQLMDWRHSVLDKYGFLGELADFLREVNYLVVIRTENVSPTAVAAMLFERVKEQLKPAKEELK